MAFSIPSAFVAPTTGCYTNPSADPFTQGEFVTPSPLFPPTGTITGISVSSITTSGFYVSCDAVTRASNYHFQWGTYSVNNTLPYAVFSGLPSATTNSLIITAYNEDGAIFSTPQNVTTLTNLPTIPTNLSASGVTSSGFTLTWTASLYATSYTATWGSYSGVVTGTSAVFSGLPSSTTKSCLVTASNAGGSIISFPYPVTTAITAPSTPTGLTSGNITNTSFTLQFLYTGSPCSFTATWGGYTGVYGGANTFTFSSLPEGTTNNAVVTATNASGSASSTPLSVATTSPTPPPAKPTGITTSVRGTSYLNFNWTDVPGVAYTATLGGNPVTCVGNTCLATGLGAYETLDLIVTATNAGGSTASDPYTSQTLDSIDYTVPGLPWVVLPASGFSSQLLGHFDIPSDFDVTNNNDLLSNTDAVAFDKWFDYIPYPTPGAFMAFRLTKVGDVNLFENEYVAYLPDPGTGNEWGYASRPNPPNWGSSNAWTFAPNDTYDMYFLIPYPGWDVIDGEVNNLSFKYNPFTTTPYTP